MPLRTLSPISEAALRVRIGSITGVHVVDIDVAPVTSGFDVVVRVSGRSPCLNATIGRWQATVRSMSAADDETAELLSAFGEHIAIQEERARAGMELGHAAPIGIAGQDDRSSGTLVGHVLVDRTLARLLEDRGSGLLSEVRDSVWLMHQEDINEDDGLTDRYSAETDDDDGREDGEQSIVGRRLIRNMHIGSGLDYDGDALRVKAQLPDTVLNAIAGRRLADVVEVPEEFASLVIASAEADSEGDGTTLVFRIVPDLATVDDLMAEWGIVGDQ